MKKSVVLIGKESVGKSQLIRSLTGKNAQSEKLKGTTINVQSYQTEVRDFIDTPGILLEADSLTTKLALDQIPEKDCILLVISATSIDNDLSDLLPLVKGKKGCIVITHLDKMLGLISEEHINKLERDLGVQVIGLDARDLKNEEKERILSGLDEPREYQKDLPGYQVKTTRQAEKGLFEVPFLGKLLSILLLFFPALVAVNLANFLADSFYESIFLAINPLLSVMNALPAPLNHLLGGDYGIFSMFPFLILYALPTVFFFSIIWSLYKTSGLIDRLTVNLHKMMAPFGLAGRDVVRVIMGFGCNVPAVISSRTCSSCTRANTISGIAFGSACSYQLPATLAVLVAADMEYLVLPYLLILVTTTLLYLWIKTPKRIKIQTSKLVLNQRDFVQWPSLRSFSAELSVLIKEFFTVAFPIFLIICLVAGILDWSGIINGLSWLLSPVMGLFNLPPEAATSVVLGSIRKDGIAIGLLNPAWDGLKVPISNPAQILTVVYLAGVLLPCLVTLLSISKEMSLKFALKLVSKQMVAAAIFSLIIGWCGFLYFNVVAQ